MSVLLTGDATSDSEASMLAAGLALDADVLKVGHHGSSTSTSAASLAAVSPADAVISVGTGNTCGHPAQETLDRLAAAGATVYRTDLTGTDYDACTDSHTDATAIGLWAVRSDGLRLRRLR
jgi:competence protein ComEC